jgi:type IV secretion system protein VirB1
MMLAASAVIGLALRCAPNVAPQTLLAVARVESGLNPLALGVNHGGARIAPPQSRAEAIERATALISQGANLDLGLAQINSANLARLGMTVGDAFDPCRNLAAAGTVLEAGYRSARRLQPDAQRALRTALSLYNTGDVVRGFKNGYVARVERSAADSPAPVVAPRIPPEPQQTAPWDAFGDVSPAAFVISPSPNQGDRP